MQKDGQIQDGSGARSEKKANLRSHQRSLDKSNLLRRKQKITSTRLDFLNYISLINLRRLDKDIWKFHLRAIKGTGRGDSICHGRNNQGYPVKITDRMDREGGVVLKGITMYLPQERRKNRIIYAIHHVGKVKDMELPGSLWMLDLIHI